jgi:multifunctional methyltransferase subunit TRM112
MRLLTHNFLRSNVKGYVHTQVLFPLRNFGDAAAARFACAFILERFAVFLSSVSRFAHSPTSRTEKGYPLLIRPVTVVVEEAPLDRELLRRILGKVDYGALQQARGELVVHCRQQHPDMELPEIPATVPELPESDNDNDDTVALSLFRWLFEIHVLEGCLVCPDTKREFPIKDGIPNMILHEDEL